MKIIFYIFLFLGFTCHSQNVKQNQIKSFEEIIDLIETSYENQKFLSLVNQANLYIKLNPDDSLRLELTKVKIDFYLRNFQYEKTKTLIENLTNSKSYYFKNVGYTRKAIYFLNTGNTKFSFEYFLKAFYYAKAKNDKKEMAIILNGLGNLYFMDNNIKKAISYYEKGYNILPNKNNIYEKNILLNNLTSTYDAIEEFSKSKYYLEIHENLKNENLDNKIIKFTYYFNFANFNVEKDILLSEQALNELKDISLKSQNDYFKGLYFKTESYLKFAKKNYTKSLVAIDSALFYFKNTKSEFYTLNTYESKIRILKKMNLFKEAFDVLDEHDKLKQKIDELQVDAYIQEAELRYNDINQKLTLTKLKLKTEKQEKLKENFIYAFIIFTIIIFFAAFLLIQNNKEINFQKKIINSKIQTNTFLTILKTEDRERKRISNELHDIVGAKMSVLKLMIENIFSEHSDDKKQYLRTTDFIDKIIEEIRQISHNLLPRNIKCVGLDKSISELVDNINNQTKVHIDYFSSGIDDKIDEYYSLFIYRIVQEFIGNMIKHSKATECILNIYKNKNQIHITIEDNGIGFEINRKHQGQGLKEIQDYIKNVNGVFEIESSPNSGTIVNIIFNLTNTTYLT